MKYETDLPVMLPLKRHQSAPFPGLKSKHILAVALIAIIGPCVAFAQAPSDQESP